MTPTACSNLLFQYSADPRLLSEDVKLQLRETIKDDDSSGSDDSKSMQASALSNLSCCMKFTLNSLLVIRTLRAAFISDSLVAQVLHMFPKIKCKLHATR